MRVPSYNDHAINARRNKKSATNRQPDRHEVVHPCLRYDLLPMSPVRTGDCVVELVGLEPTTKVLWNMVRVRPTPPGRTPTRSAVPTPLGWGCPGHRAVLSFKSKSYADSEDQACLCPLRLAVPQ